MAPTPWHADADECLAVADTPLGGWWWNHIRGPVQRWQAAQPYASAHSMHGTSPGMMGKWRGVPGAMAHGRILAAEPHAGHAGFHHHVTPPPHPHPHPQLLNPPHTHGPPPQILQTRVPRPAPCASLQESMPPSALGLQAPVVGSEQPPPQPCHVRPVAALAPPPPLVAGVRGALTSTPPPLPRTKRRAFPAVSTATVVVAPPRRTPAALETAPPHAPMRAHPHRRRISPPPGAVAEGTKAAVAAMVAGAVVTGVVATCGLPAPLGHGMVLTSRQRMTSEAAHALSVPHATPLATPRAAPLAAPLGVPLAAPRGPSSPEQQGTEPSSRASRGMVACRSVPVLDLLSNSAAHARLVDHCRVSSAHVARCHASRALQ